MNNKLGNGSTFRCLGTSTHTDHDREVLDLYCTDPKACELLLEVEPDINNVWECCTGLKHLSNVLEKHNKLGRMSDIVNRTDDNRIEVIDFLKDTDNIIWNGSIVTNPPYRNALDFVKQALKVITEGNKVCMFLKLQFLEGKERKQFFLENPPKIVYVCSSRIVCAINGEFEKVDEKTGKSSKISSAVCYAWFVWEKGFKGEPVIRWIN